MLRPQPSRLVSVVLLLSALVILGCSEASETGTREAIILNFDLTAVGALPAGFSTAVTGGGGPAVWRVAEDASAPSGGKVLAQTSTDKTSSRFPLCVYEGLSATDVEVSVRFKPVSGTVDQAAGLVARYRDKGNYYIVRANALENNVRLYKVERGNRTQFTGAVGKVFATIKDTSRGRADVPRVERSPADTFLDPHTSEPPQVEISPAQTSLDPNVIEDLLGVKGQLVSGVYKVTIGRTTKMHGHEVGNAMGVNTWAAFAGSDAQAVVDGDFVMWEHELQPVLKALRGAGINIVAIHHHMTGDSPRTVFLHYWGVGPTRALATGLKAALETQRP